MSAGHEFSLTGSYLVSNTRGLHVGAPPSVSLGKPLEEPRGKHVASKQASGSLYVHGSIKSNRVLIGGPLYKDRKRKRRLSETIRETIEREKRKREQQEESETSSQTGTTGTEEDDLASATSEVESTTAEEEEEEEEESDEETIERLFPISIPENLKYVLEKDRQNINDKDMLLDLPTENTALNLLENYVKFFAVRYLARTKEKRRSEVKEKDKTFLTLDLCKEVMDGIRICFDFHIETHLLYAKERRQAERLRSAQPLYAKRYLEPTKDLSLAVDDKENFEGMTINKEEPDEEGKSKVDKASKEEERAKDTPGRRQLRSKRPLSGDSSSTEKEKNLTNLACESGRSTPTTVTSGASIAGIGGLARTDFTLPLSYRSIQPHLQDWTLLPETHRDPPPPSLIYGPLHLLRLFVKLPEILFRMNLPEIKRRIIIKHLELFLEYVSSHSDELFMESHYIPNPDV
ncbi:putative male-specific lethal-3 protein-like 2 [Penaeus chinensis]|uniref:putative male-specific lethal-3 protein-like 2 n=1 Tax=Penaeus chinensis TaxID=139456 RepID=UPI001FB72550|nr:putative male-specific lethal-3 protein-like 2 [Penaeus chinensis]